MRSVGSVFTVWKPTYSPAMTPRSASSGGSAFDAKATRPATSRSRDGGAITSAGRSWPLVRDSGIVVGHAAVRPYWTRQWGLIDPRVEPRGFTAEADGRVAVAVHQVVRDLTGKVLKEDMVQHVYAFEGGLITSMEIR